jgi:hypothetical protein
MIGERRVSREDAEKVAKQFSLPYFETSSKDNVGIENAIESLIPQMIAAFVPQTSDSTLMQQLGDEKNRRSEGGGGSYCCW